MGTMEEPSASAERKEETAVTERKYALITAIVNQGYSEEVMNAARGAGARGGTVLHSRRIADEASLSAMGLEIQEEREMILIVAQEEEKVAIMQAIGSQCGIQSPAQGVVLSLPIDNAIGLR
jgi:nitrogen regulatory protein PII